MTYAVMGVTGKTGSVVADQLLSNKRPVCVIVRNAAKGDSWRQKGAEGSFGRRPRVAFPTSCFCPPSELSTRKALGPVRNP